MKKLLLLFAVVALASCSNDTKDLDSSVTPQYDGKVDFTATITGETRVLGTEFQDGDAIVVTAFDGETAFKEEVTYTYASDKFESTNAIELEEFGSLSYIAAYPAGNINDFGTAFEFTALTDQNTDTNQTMSDLLVATLDATTSTTPELNFDHAMSSLVIKFDFSGETGATEGTLAINGQAKVAVDLATESYIGTGDVATFTPADNGSDSYTVIFAPQDIAKGEVVAVYTTADNVYTWTANNDLTFETGVRYTYTWAIDTTIPEADYEGTVTLTSKIVKWTDEVLTDDPVVTPAMLVYASNDYVSGGSSFNYIFTSNYTLAEAFDADGIAIGDLTTPGTITFATTDYAGVESTEDVNLTFSVVDDKLVAEFPATLTTCKIYSGDVTVSYGGEDVTFALDYAANGYPIDFEECLDETTTDPDKTLLTEAKLAGYVYEEESNTMTIYAKTASGGGAVADGGSGLVAMGFVEPSETAKAFLTKTTGDDMFVTDFVLVDVTEGNTISRGQMASYPAGNCWYTAYSNWIDTGLTTTGTMATAPSILDFITIRYKGIITDCTYELYVKLKFSDSSSTQVWYNTGMKVNMQP